MTIELEQPLGDQLDDLRCQLADAEDDLRHANLELDAVNKENIDLDRQNDRLISALQESAVESDVLQVIAKWHDETHPSPRFFCDEEPCRAMRRLEGYVHPKV